MDRLPPRKCPEGDVDAAEGIRIGLVGDVVEPLVADRVRWPGYGNGRRHVTTSARYQDPVMKGIKDKIGPALAPDTAPEPLMSAPLVVLEDFVAAEEALKRATWSEADDGACEDARALLLRHIRLHRPRRKGSAAWCVSICRRDTRRRVAAAACHER